VTPTLELLEALAAFAPPAPEDDEEGGADELDEQAAQTSEESRKRPSPCDGFMGNASRRSYGASRVRFTAAISGS
jgi:hypothetical protein